MDVENFLKETAVKIDKIIEKYIPRKFGENALLFKIISPRYAYNTEALNKALAEPFWEFLDRGGKRWRPALFLLVCEALGKPPQDFLDFAIIPEIIHNGTIIIDDVEDDSQYRRGKPCIHRIYGLDVAVNLGNAIYYLPLLPLIEKRSIISDQKLSKIYEIYVEEMIKLSLGQAMDIAWHKGLADANHLTEEAYMQMCAYKTGTLARMAAKMAAVLADANDELVEKIGRFAESMGVAFQIQDDLLDIISQEFARKKGGQGQDITEGKRSLIVIYTLKKASQQDRERLIEILNMHTSDEKLKEEAIGIIKKYGAIEYAKNYARKIVEESWKEIDPLLSASKAKEKLRAFANYLIQRKI
jgi:geranylgeranyl pyrophosphate synthase